MPIKSTNINGFTVAIENNGCTVSKGRFQGSIALVEATGNIEDGNETMVVPSTTINRICAWAQQNGFPDA